MQETIIEAGRTEKNYWRDLWHFRELFYTLAWRDVAVRYKQTVIGVAWSVIRPLLTMIVFSIVFGRLAKLPSEGVPYPILVFVAMLPWQFFATGLAESSNSLVANAPLISKVYFPRLIVPISSVIVSLVDFLIATALLILMIIGYHVLNPEYSFVFTWRLLLLPAFVILAFGAAMGIGLWLGALNVKYRDFRHIIPFIVQFGLYISPVGFSSSVVPEQWRLLYSTNPMVGVIDGFRWALIGKDIQLFLPGIYLSIGLTTLLLITGIWYFRHTERRFADVI